MRKWPVVLLAVIILVLVTKLPATAVLLHEFTGGGDDGESPSGSLLLSNAILYGMTFDGGDNNRGVIFSMDMDGSNFKLLREFSGWDDGQFPWGSLIPANSNLYGMTYQGGNMNKGVIFSMGMDGSNFELLREFDDIHRNDGAEPFGDLILSNSTIYGMTSVGGDSGKGVIFSIGTDGSNFTLLHEFAGGDNDGAKPSGSFILSNTTLYGMALEGGDSNKGVIFSIGTDGSNFTLLHEFAGGNDDGTVPYGSLILSNSTLYGMTYQGGDDDVGVIFSIGTDGSDFILLHKFAGGNDDGSLPYDSLILSNSNLYGTTAYGGNSNKGVIFSIGTDGANFTLLHEFDGINGSRPYGSLLLENSTLYGMTKGGGASDKGVVFSYILVPSIISFTPTSGSTGTTVTITGTNFTGATAVKFGGTDAQSYTVDSAIWITAVVGTGSTGNITVTTPHGTATSASAFIYVPVPTVTTQAVTGITTTTADGNGNITDLGSTNPTQHGVCWNTSGTPTTADSKTSDGAVAATGTFTSNVTGLSPKTTYYVRAYATNTAGTSYGNQVSFTTSTQAPTVTTEAMTAIGTTMADGNGNITDLGAPDPTQHGVCWNTNGTPTTADSKTEKGAASATGAFASHMTGLSANTTYYVRAYATNTAGTSYGTQVSFTTRAAAATVTTQAISAIGTTTATGNGNITDLGSPAPTQHGVCWNTAGTPTTGDNKTEEGPASATGAFTSNLTGLSPTTYYVRAYVIDAVGTIYGNQVSFTISGGAPTVTTEAMTSIDKTTATGHGNITKLGFSNPTQHGVCWNTSGTPTTADSKTEDGPASATGAFTSLITGLQSGTDYYVRAYATNTGGTSYGNQISFASAGKMATGYPHSYKVTVTKVEMHNGTSWVTIFSGTAQLDMVPGGTFPGISDLSLPAGTYSQVRITFKNSFPVTGTLSHGGTAYYTTATTFEGQTNLASTPTTVAGNMMEFTFYEPAWGALNKDVTQTYSITPATIGPGTDYQPTLRFTVSTTFNLNESAAPSNTEYFTLGVPPVSVVAP